VTLALIALLTESLSCSSAVSKTEAIPAILDPFVLTSHGDLSGPEVSGKADQSEKQWGSNHSSK